MDLFNRIRSHFHLYLLRKEIPSHQISRSTVFFKTAKKVGLVFDATNLEDAKVAQSFAQKLEKDGLEVSALGYFDKKITDQVVDFEFFTKKQLDWALRPKMTSAVDFAKQPFDLLINLSKRAQLPIDYIAAHSKARFRVGPYTSNTFSYDLMIEPEKNTGLQDFLKQVLHYLEHMQPAINPTNSAQMTVTG